MSFFGEIYIEGGFHMRTISVEPDQLENVAGKIETANSDYERIYQAMYAEVDKMSSCWQGKDNTMFTSQIKAFQDDLRQISIVMREYAQFLRSSARSYREAQEEICNRASKLGTI